jgi:hypothetical protein
MFNNRQIASLLWIAVALVFVVAHPKVRSSIPGVLRALVAPAILFMLAALAAWSYLLVRLGEAIGIWTPAIAGDTWFWFFTTAIVLLFNMQKVSTEKDFFITTAKATFGVTFVFSFLSDLWVVSVPAEFVAQGLIALFAGMSVVARSPEHAQVKKLVDGCLSCIGLAVVALAARALFLDWSDADKAGLARQLAMPAWMTIGLLPFIYAVGLYSAYQQVFLRIGWAGDASRWVRARAKAALVVGLHFRATHVGRFNPPWPHRLVEAPTFRAGLKVTDDFQRAITQEDADSQEALDRLGRFADVDGTDANGLRLDRREFEATASALRWVSTCAMGWHTDDGGYRPDIMEIVADLTRYGLPDDHGVQVEVSPDGSAWFAWRRTVTGWVFAIGAGGPPADQWEYDGPEPPDGFPGQDPAWGSGPFSEDANPNW